MADLMRATSGVPGFQDAADIWLVEASPTLAAIQRDTLKAHQVSWADKLSGLPDAPLFLIANEFFDALPIRQYQRAGDGWRERVIGLTGGALGFGLAPMAAVPALAHRLDDTKQGDVVETCPQAAVIAQESARGSRPGAARR